MTAYLEKITGAKFEVIEEKDLPSGVPAIYLGVTKYAGAQGIDFSKLSSEESVLRTVGKNLILAGGRPRGTLYAVYEFLENDLGCRWYTPWCEKVPSKPICSVPAINKRIKPFMMYRDNQVSGTDDPEGIMFPARNRLSVHKRSFMKCGDTVGAQNIYAVIMGGCHGFWYMTANFADHPEYFSMRRGKRIPANKEGKGGCGMDGHICLTNPDVLKIIIEEVKKDIRKDIKDGVDALCYTVAINDVGDPTICDCPECRKVAKQYGASDNVRCSDAGLLIWFVNQVADGIMDEFPDKFIRTLAYNPTGGLPPKNIKVRDNVIVQVCHGGTEEWTKISKHVWRWDYTLTHRTWDFYRPWIWDGIEALKKYKNMGTVDGIFQENDLWSHDSLFAQFSEMHRWIFARLCHNPELSESDLIADFVNGYYGETAAPMILKYIDLIKVRMPKYPYYFFDYEFMKETQELFDQTEAAVKGDQEHLMRIKELRLNLDLAGLVFRNMIIRSYLRGGGKLEEYPYPIPVLKARISETLNTTKHPFLTGTTTRYYLPGRGGVQSYLNIVKQYVEEVSQGAKYAPLPKEVENIAPENIIELTTPLIAGQDFPIGTRDPEAAMGLAIPKMSTNELPLPIGVWDNSVDATEDPDSELAKNQREFLKLDQTQKYVDWPGICRVVSTNDITGPGYHMYKGPHFKLRPNQYVYLTQSWRYQYYPKQLFDPGNPNQFCDVYVSMKFTGPAFPHGNTNEPSGVFFDRVIFVKAVESGVVK